MKKFFFKITVSVLVNGLAFWGASNILIDILKSDSVFTFFVAGGILGFLNFIIKPILSLISLPLIFITFGLFLAVLNVFLLFLTESIMEILGFSFHIEGGIFSYLITAFCMSVLNTVLYFIIPKR